MNNTHQNLTQLVNLNVTLYQMKFTLLFLLSFFSSTITLPAAESNEFREVDSLSKGWLYLERNIPFQEAAKVADGWQTVDLPHSWNALDATDIIPGYRRDASWYRKALHVAHIDPNRTYILYFEGANITTDVYINGQSVGHHTGGYIGFEFDVSRFLIAGDNDILIRVDNSVNRDIIPSQKSDFFIYGGIVRDLWLCILPKIHVERVQIKTPAVSQEKAETIIDILFSAPLEQGYDVEIRITNEIGDVVSMHQIESRLFDANHHVKIEMPSVRKPLLWSPESPNLYNAVVILSRGNKTVDKTTERFGYRWFEFKDHGPFYLNGERLLLRGTHRHEDHAGYGMAMPDLQHRKDIEQIKEMGANFVRLAHYPQDPSVYKACDELGLLVWDELPWCRGGVGSSTWKATTLKLLEAQIAQNFNHPSIIIWSLGNEIYWDPDFENGGNNDSLRSFLTVLNEKAHLLDPDRLTAIRKYTEGADIIDVYSPSIWAGWYSGPYDDYEKAITTAKESYRHFLHAEYGASSHLGRHNPFLVASDGGFTQLDASTGSLQSIKLEDIPEQSDWSETYQVDLMDWHLHVSENQDWFAGNAQWAFKDFATPLRPENPIPYVNQKGVVDRAGNPKDAYFVYRSYWTDQPKFVYIESHTWPVRSAYPGQHQEISVYSNCDSVELFLNGRSLGMKSRQIGNFPAHGLTWPVTFIAGGNFVMAVGKTPDSESVTDSMSVEFCEEPPVRPRSILLTSKPLENGNILVEAIAVDQANHRCPQYQKRIYFSHSGVGKLLYAQGTRTGSRVIEMANGYAAIEFEPSDIGVATIGAMTQDIKENFVRITVDKRKRSGLLHEASRD